MHTKTRKNLILSAGISLVALLTTVTVSQTPRPSPSPSPKDEGDYVVSASMEAGYRGLSVNGDGEKYRSDLNYKPGLRAFNSSFFIENRSKGNTVFDEALFQASGWGSDPTGSTRINISKTGAYKFDANVRRVQYYNNLNNFDHGWAFAPSAGSEHRMNTIRNFGDFDMTIFPESEKFRMNFGYSFNNQNGPGAWTIRFPAFESPTFPGTSGTRGDEFQVNSRFRNNTQDFRAGVAGEVLGFNLGLNYGHRNFQDRTVLTIDSFSLGNDISTNTTGSSVSATANSFFREYPTKGTTDYVNFNIQRTFAKKLDFTGRFIYASSISNVAQNDNGSGTSTGSPTATTGTARVLFTLDQVMVTGRVKRPQSRGDIGLTYRATDNFRISDTFNFDQFTIGGANDFFENMVGTAASNGTPFNSISNNRFTENTSYRRFTNLVEADYQVNKHFAFNVGYRYTHRKVFFRNFEVNAVTHAVVEDEFDDFTNTTNSVLVGAKIKPTNSWSIFADFERGTSDNVFTRLANGKYTNFRVRSVSNWKQFTLNFSGLIRNNDVPGMISPGINGVPTNVLATSTIANTRTRYFSGSVDYNPAAKWTLSAGYTYNFQDSNADILVPVGAPINSSTQWLFGKSMYFVRDNYFFFDFTARPIKRVTMFVSYRIDNDSGQGSTVSTRPQDIITSYPIRYQTPEVKLAFKLNDYVDWNVGYQYFSYRETVIPDPFARIILTGITPSTGVLPLFAAQNYTAHMPYTSLTIYLGKAKDR